MQRKRYVDSYIDKLDVIQGKIIKLKIFADEVGNALYGVEESGILEESLAQVVSETKIDLQEKEDEGIQLQNRAMNAFDSSKTCRSNRFQLYSV